MSNAEIVHVATDADYHASSGIGDGLWITRSLIKCYDESPRGCWLRYVDGEPLAQFNGNKATDLGTLVDMLTTGERWRIATWPQEYITESGRRSTGKDAMEWQEDAERMGMVVVSPSDMDLAQLMIREAKRDIYLAAILESNQRQHQVVVRWHDEETGLPLQIKIDTVIPGKLLADIKTGHGAPRNFCKSADQYGYDLQAVMYAEGYRLATGEDLPFAFAYMQTTYPFESKPIVLPQAIIESAHKRYRAALRGIAAGDWGQPENAFFEPEIPGWWYHLRESENGA